MQSTTDPNLAHRLTLRDNRYVTTVWQGVLDADLMPAQMVKAGHRLADAAKAGDWPRVMKTLGDERSSAFVNQWRPGGTAWFTPLHQAAWHGAPHWVVHELFNRGALRSIPDAKGRTAYDIANGFSKQDSAKKFAGKEVEEKYDFELRLLLEVKEPSTHYPGKFEHNLAELVNRTGWLGRGDIRKSLRLPPMGVLNESNLKLWMPGDRWLYVALHNSSFDGDPFLEIHAEDGSSKESYLVHGSGVVAL